MLSLSSPMKTPSPPSGPGDPEHWLAIGWHAIGCPPLAVTLSRTLRLLFPHTVALVERGGVWVGGGLGWFEGEGNGTP